LTQNELALFLSLAIAGVVPEAPAQADNGWQAHLVHYLFDSLRGASQHVGPASRPRAVHKEYFADLRRDRERDLF
jgi:hypothetical protein